MPYVKADDRIRLNAGELPATAGELNYVITRAVNTYLCREGLSYANLNEAIGVLECAKLELYQRVIADYENEKMRVNGDVYSGLTEPAPGVTPSEISSDQKT